MRWLAFLLAANAFAVSLADLQTTANRLRAQRSRPPGSLGESRLLTEFKDQLREWVESRITGEIANPRSVQDQLNRTLSDAGLMCGAACDDQVDQNVLGYLSDLQLDRLPDSRGWLMLKTSVGIVCGNDESVYIYERVAGQWRRRFESQQDQFGQAYAPQYSIEVRSAVDATGQRLVFTSGISPGCASSWQIGYFRLFRLGARRPLLERQHAVHLGEEEHEFRLLPDELLVRLRDFVLHYKIEGDQVRRIEPLAPSPAAFVDEWRVSPWSEVAQWSDPSLASWHAQVKEPQLIFGLWDDVALCLKRPGQWQIEAEIDHEAVYFLVEESVEERAPSSYRMRDVSTEPHQGCEH